MMNNRKEDAATLALNETGVNSGNEAKILSGDDKSTARSFGVVELWNMRRNARVFKIHNRIPRL